MKIFKALKSIAAGAIISCTGAAFANEGHGMQSAHWHASDAWGFVVIGALLASAILMTRGGK